MARAYTVATSSLALDVPAKWIDNVLSHYDVPGVSQERQGVARRVGIDGLLILALSLILIQDLGVPIAPALRIATFLSGNKGAFASPQGVAIEIDLSEVRTHLLQRLAIAVEVAPVPTRGRPPASKTGRLD